jgi:hypothetical protein
VLITKARVL